MAYEYYYGEDSYEFGAAEYDETAPWEEGAEATWDESWAEGNQWEEWGDEAWEDWDPKEWKTPTVTPSAAGDARKWNVLVNAPTPAKAAKGDVGTRDRTSNANGGEQSQDVGSTGAGEGNKSGGSGRRKRSASRTPRRRSAQRQRRHSRHARTRDVAPAAPREAASPRCHLVPAPQEAPVPLLREAPVPLLAPVPMMAGLGARDLMEPLEPPPGLF